MILALLLYILLLLFFASKSYQLISDYKDFSIAGQNQGTYSVAFSMLASIVGGSAIFGITDLTNKLGFPAFWWLGLGACFLFLQASLLTKKVRALNAYSLPHVARITLSNKFSLLVSLAIVFSWIGIIAAQFSAIAHIIGLISADFSKEFFIVISAILVIVYTFLGGQLSVMKTDLYQFILLFIGIIIAFALLYFTNFAVHKSLSETVFSASSLDILKNNFELFNEKFTKFSLFELALLAGLPYFIGPDVFSRILSAKNEDSAQKGVRLASIILLFFAFFITSLGLWISKQHEITSNPLVYLISNYLPLPLAILLILGIISALISSADTCLMSVVTIIEHDILQKKSIKRSRVFVVVIGIISLIFALYHQSIIPMLLSAYSIYVPGVVIPLFFGIMYHNKKELNKNFIFLALVLGGGLGIIATLTKMSELSLVGIALSLGCSLLSLVFSKPSVMLQKNVAV